MATHCRVQALPARSLARTELQDLAARARILPARVDAVVGKRHCGRYRLQQEFNMKAILIVLALVFTSALFAQEPRRQPARDFVSKGAQQRQSVPRDERVLPPRERQRATRSRADVEREQGGGGPRRPGHAKPPHGGRDSGQAEPGPRHRHRGETRRCHAEGPRREGMMRGSRPWAGSAPPAWVRERARELRQVVAQRLRERALDHRQAVLESMRSRGMRRA